MAQRDFMEWGNGASGVLWLVPWRNETQKFAPLSEGHFTGS